VFFNGLGEIRDWGFGQQRYRASGLNLVTAAIVLWNTVYLERAANALRGQVQAAAPTRWALACFKFRFLRRPLVQRRFAIGRYV